MTKFYEQKHDRLVSIGMPVYNGGQFIRQALEALIAQDYPFLELIISDNASTDDTQAICLEYVDKDSRIKYFCNQTNEGAISNFNKVLEIASGEYFMWAAHDDLWEPKYVSTLADILSEDEKVVIAFSMFNLIDDNNHEITNYPSILNIPDDNIYQRSSNYLNQFEGLGKANPIYGLMRKKFTQDALGATMRFLMDNVWASDMLFVFQMLLLGKFTVAPKTLFHKRLLPNSPSVTIQEDWSSYFAGYEYLIKHTDKLDNSQKQKLMKEVWLRKISRKITPLDLTMQRIKCIIPKQIKSIVKKVWLFWT